jgi:hypothetical protein
MLGKIYPADFADERRMKVSFNNFCENQGCLREKYATEWRKGKNLASSLYLDI